MVQIITSFEDINPNWLTTVLQHQGILTGGSVVTLDKNCATPFGATVCNINVVYSNDVSDSVPDKLFLKILSGITSVTHRGIREFQFYQLMMTDNHILPIPKCYYAQYDAESGALNLLLADLSDTHFALEHEIPPTEKQCYQLMDILAQIHAYWWESPKLGLQIGSVPTEQALADEFAEDVSVYQAFADYLGDRLMPSRRGIYEHIIHKFLAIKQKRFANNKKLTLSHGDAHAWNFLYPRQQQDMPYLLDWEALGVNIGTNDLAYMMAVFWHPARRQWLEESLVKHYHNQLLAHGIQNYTWDDCWYDYRLAIVGNLFMPAWWWKHNTPAFLWWHRLERLMMAYEDLNCAELLG